MVLSVLLANEPQAYRDAISVALRILRPEIKVISVEPKELDTRVMGDDPQVVICSDLTLVLDREVPIWIVLYPGGASGAILQILGERSTVGEMSLDEIVRLIDLTNQLLHDRGD